MSCPSVATLTQHLLSLEERIPEWRTGKVGNKWQLYLEDGGKRELQYQYWSCSSGARFLEIGIAMGEFRVGYMGERDNVLATPERWCVQGVTMFYVHGCGF